MSAGPMPPPPLKWQPVQFIWLNSCWPSVMASLFPSNRPPIASGGDGGATPLGKRLVTETSLGPRPALGAVSCCAPALFVATTSTAARAIGRSRAMAAGRSGFRQREYIERPSGAGLELPFELACLGVDGFEPAIHCPLKDESARGGHRAAPQRQVLLDGPDRLALYRIPCSELAAIAAGAWLAHDLGADERRALDVANGPALPIHA